MNLNSDSSGLESFLIVNVPAKGGAKEKKEKWVLHFLLLVLNSTRWRGARQGGVVFQHGMDSIINLLIIHFVQLRKLNF
jgi:hypothetical protein